jgi:hypothetical protein
MIDAGLVSFLFSFVGQYGFTGFLIVVIGGFVWLYCRSIRMRNVFPLSNLTEKIHRDQHINGALDSMLSQFRASRAFVYQYHNGQMNTAGIHFDKISMTHERVQVEIRQTMMQMQNIPNSLFSGFNYHILAGKKLFLSDVEQLKKTDMGLYQLVKNQGVKSLYLVGIFGFHNEPVGMVGIDYDLEPHVLCNKQLDRLQAAALKICGLILAEKGSA